MSRQNSFPRSQNAAIVGTVVVLHVIALWALQSRQIHSPTDVFIPVTLLSVFIDPPAPKELPRLPKPPKPPKPLEPVVRPIVKATPPAQPKAQTAPLQPIADFTPIANAPTGLLTAQTPASINSSAAAIVQEPAQPPFVASAPPAAPVSPAPARVELPSTDADYLQNPRPVYPPASKRLGEQGQVVHSVLIGLDGQPISAKLIKSSGFERLDAAAYVAVMSWRYVPGKRNGVVAQMAYNVPINWVLE